MAIDLRDLSNPETQKWLADKVDKNTGKPVLKAIFQDGAKSARRLDASIEKSQQKTKQNKYKNVRTERNGVKYDSVKEANRHDELKLLEKAGKISQLKYHKVYKFYVNGIKICSYEADFYYIDEAGEVVVEDVKSKYFMQQKGDAPYKIYHAKKMLMLALFGIDVKEIVY